MMHFDLKALLLILLGAGIFYIYLKKFPLRRKGPRLFFSTLSHFRSPDSLRIKWAYLPRLFILAGFGSLLLAFIDPHQILPRQDMGQSLPKEGMAIYLLLDRSGSMGGVVDQINIKGRWEGVSKFDLLKTVTADFIRKDPNDLIGVIAFARAAQVVSPLTLDHNQILSRLDKLSVIKDKTQDGTGIGYAIYKSAHLIEATKAFQEGLKSDEKPPYTIQNAVIVVITDGLQDPSLLDKGDRYRSMELEEAADFAKSKGIRVYIISVEPRIKEEQFAPNRREMERITQTTGGKLIMADRLDQWGEVLKAIGQTEKNRFADESRATFARKSYFPAFIILGLSCLGIALLLRESLWRRLP